jgi:Fe-S-cluster containining protein
MRRTERIIDRASALCQPNRPARLHPRMRVHYNMSFTKVATMPKSQVPSSSPSRSRRSATTAKRPVRAAPAATRPVVRGPRSLPVIAQPQPASRTPVPCLDCGLCCSYVALEIDGPTTLRAATDILWYLYHQNICIYVESDEWMVQIETRCQHYHDDHKCGIYETRPQICRDYDETSCEINAEDVGTVFYNTGEYLDYLRQHHKRMHTLIQKRYMPPADTLQGKSVGRKRVGPFRPRYDALRQRGLAQ